MKKLLLFSTLLVSFFIANSQVEQNPSVAGRQENNFTVRKAFKYPTLCGSPQGRPFPAGADTSYSALAFDSCNKRLWIYDPSTNLWDTIKGGATILAGWGQTKDGDILYAGGKVDGIIGYAIRNNWSPGTPSTMIEYSNHETKDSLAPGIPGTALNRPIGVTDGTYATAMVQYNIDHKEIYNDTANLQYGNGVTIVHRYTAKPTGSIWGKLGVKKVFSGRDMGFHVTNQLYMPIDTVDVYVDIDGRSGASYNSMFGLGDSVGYNIRIFSRDVGFPFVGGYSSVLDLQRVASRTHMRRVTGNGLTSYIASSKGWQAAISPSTPEVGHYINKVYDYFSEGLTATTSDGATKEKILLVSKIDTVIGYYSAPKWKVDNEVYNGYGFVAAGDSDYNYMARHLKIGGSLPSRVDGKTKHLFEVTGGEAVIKNTSDKIRARLNGTVGTTAIFAQDVFDGTLYDYSTQINGQSNADSASKMRKGYVGSFSKEMFPVDGVGGQFHNIFSSGGLSSNYGIHPQKGIDSMFISQDFNSAATWSNLSLQGFYDSSDLKIYGPNSSRTLNGLSNVLARLDINAKYGIIRGTINNFNSIIRGNRKANSEIEWINHFSASQPYATADNGQKTKTVVGLYIEPQKVSIVNRGWGVLSYGTDDYNSFAGYLFIGDTSVANMGSHKFVVSNGTSFFKDKIYLNNISTGLGSDSVLVLDATTKEVKKVSSSLFGGGGSGTVTSVAAGYGMSFTAITTSGTVVADTSVLLNQAGIQVISGSKRFTNKNYIVGNSEAQAGLFFTDATMTQNAGRLHRDGGTGGFVISGTFTELTLNAASFLDFYSGSGHDIRLRPQGGGKLWIGAGADLATEMLTVDGNIRVLNMPNASSPDTVVVTEGGVLKAGPIVQSGTWTPTLFNTTNVSASTAYVGQWMRVGNTVTASGIVEVTPTTGGLATLLGISLPVASALTLNYQIAGTGASESNTEAVAIEGDAANDRARLTWPPAANGNRIIHYHFTYQVL